MKSGENLIFQEVIYGNVYTTYEKCVVFSSEQAFVE